MKKIKNEAALTIAGELKVDCWQIEALIKLFDDDATVPFIARYRKEATGGLDEVVIGQARERLAAYEELRKRKAAILKSLTERELLTDELNSAIGSAVAMNELEDIYLPYKPKRRTRATIAREKGLEPLAVRLYSQDSSIRPESLAVEYISDERGVNTVQEALSGASDIIAEMVSENLKVRTGLRDLFLHKGVLFSTVIKKNRDKGEKFKDYFDISEKVATIPSHRALAVFRGEAEEVLRLKIRPDQQEAMRVINRYCQKKNCSYIEYISAAFEDAYTRLLAPSLENEVRAELKDSADKEAVKVFAQNLRELLMSAPLGGRRMLAIDPGVRTGCKLVALSENGDLLENSVIYPDRDPLKSEELLRSWIERFGAEVIAIGNGTYGRETEGFVRGLKLAGVEVVMVSESGASIYSASETAREEFPDYDLTVRGAVSIGRRLMDPLAELVKIDPKSIGVGQYQHDVDQKLLRESLDSVVISCVNAVGVEVNTASKELLSYVSGLGRKLAENIVEYRKTNGRFVSRKDLLKVPRLGAKAYEQAAGFIRVAASKNPLDRSAVHPESYSIVERMAAESDCSLGELLASSEARNRIELKNYVTDKVGMPTLTDIMNELARPGRDPRDKFVAFSFSDQVEGITDLKAGMELPGIVTNVTNFGAFVDIGVHQDGLVHISQLADTFVKDPSDFVKIQQQVRVRVLEVDTKRKRISLSMKK